ncbi:MAG: MmgE/PrpD family protein, partial [Rhodocyclaceae bacterium]|nr:MmgE/PrpD family protein [Rhodocyclaceae bacterium]
PLDSLLELITSKGVRAEDVAQVDIRVAKQGANTVDNREMPDICMQHLAAVMLLDRTVTFVSTHDVARMRDSKVLALRKRVTLTGDEALTRAMPSRQGIVSITLKDGTKLTHHTKAVRGTAENPMSRAEVDAKCYDLLAPITGKRRARRLCDTVWSLDRLADVRALRPLLKA